MDKVWWNQITNAHRFIVSVTDTMLAEKSLILTLPKKIPWYETMKETIEYSVMKQNSQKSFDFVDSPQRNVGEFLMNRYCREEKRVQYRPNKSYACFLAECSDIVLNDRYVWVKNIPSYLYEEWILFLADYVKCMKKNRTPAVFILELYEEVADSRGKKGIVNFSFQKEISDYDKYTFCALAASSVSCKDFLRPYLAETVSSVCGEDIELCAHCIRKGRQFLENPYEVLSQITKSERRSDETEFEFPFHEEFLERKVWEAQIRTVFPQIEHYRRYFVDKYRGKIEKLLPIRNSNGEEITDPSELEIGALNYMAAAELLNLDTVEHNHLHMLKEARNTLAHLKTIPQKDVESIYNAALKIFG